MDKLKININTAFTTTGQIIWVVETDQKITKSPELIRALDEQETLTPEAKLHLFYEVEKSFIRPEFMYSIPKPKEVVNG